MELNKQKKYQKLTKPKISFTKDQEMQKKIRSILGYDDDVLNKKETSNKLKINYNKKVYFDQANKFSQNNNSEKQIQKFISNVFNDYSNPPIFDKIQKGSNIKFNFNINNNFYNSNSNNNNSNYDYNDQGKNYKNNYSETINNNQRISHSNYQNNLSGKKFLIFFR